MVPLQGQCCVTREGTGARQAGTTPVEARAYPGQAEQSARGIRQHPDPPSVAQFSRPLPRPSCSACCHRPSGVGSGNPPLIAPCTYARSTDRDSILGGAERGSDRQMSPRGHIAPRRGGKDAGMNDSPGADARPRTVRPPTAQQSPNHLHAPKKSNSSNYWLSTDTGQ